MLIPNIFSSLYLAIRAWNCQNCLNLSLIKWVMEKGWCNPKLFFERCIAILQNSEHQLLLQELMTLSILPCSNNCYLYYYCASKQRNEIATCNIKNLVWNASGNVVHLVVLSLNDLVYVAACIRQWILFGKKKSSYVLIWIHDSVHTWYVYKETEFLS